MKQTNINNLLSIAFLFVFLFISLAVVGFGLAKNAPYRDNCEGIEVEMFRTQLALLPSAESTQRSNVESKIRAWETMIAICENNTPVTNFPSITSRITRMPTNVTPTTVVTGIFEGQPDAFFHSFEANIENHWRGVVNGNYVTVFAGEYVDDPGQGFLAVKIAPPHGHAIWGSYLSPTKAGALRIVDAQGTRLVVQQTNNSDLLYFDIPALVFVDSLAEVVTPQNPLPGIVTTPITPTPIPPYPAPLITITVIPYPIPSVEATLTAPSEP